MKKLNKFMMVLLVAAGLLSAFRITHNSMEFNNAVILQDENSNKYVDKTLIMDYTEIVGDVSEEVVQEFVNTVATQVPQAAFNFLVNSGGKVYLVEGADVSDYRKGESVAYSPDNWATAGTTWVKTIRFFHKETITSTNIYVAADKIDSTLHEFMHVFDCSMGYVSQSDEFRQIFKNIDEYHVFDVNREDYSLEYTSQDFYYLGSAYECFAEIMARYVTGSISDERLQEYCKGVLESI